MSQQLLQDQFVRPPDLAAVVADRLEALIVEGHYVAGQRLPSERALAGLLNVSRNVIREGTKRLQERGLVSVQPGSGVYVTACDTASVRRSVALYVRRQQVTIAQVYEARWALEMENARLASLQASDRDRAALAANVAACQDHVSQPAIFTPLDVEFHLLLAHATGNPILPLLLETITSALHDHCRLTENLPGAQHNALMHHSRILAAVQAQDAAAAQAAMREHLHSGWAWLLRVVTNPQEEIGEISLH